tara:strand:+ start:10634 stop:11209 length:576 start_codon:yes stop_codon:yes gene_type:complete
MSIPVQQVFVKIPLKSTEGLNLDAFIPIFHEWIREHSIDNELLIDVADYRHVPDGPGVMLIANEAHYGIDSDGGSTGLMYRRRRDEHGDAEAAFRQALGQAVRAANLIEKEEGLSLSFDTSRIEMRVLSRLTTPNTEATHEALAPVWSKVLTDLGFAGPELAPPSDPRQPFGLAMLSCTSAPDLATLVTAL